MISFRRSYRGRQGERQRSGGLTPGAQLSRNSRDIRVSHNTAVEDKCTKPCAPSQTFTRMERCIPPRGWPGTMHTVPPRTRKGQANHGQTRTIASHRTVNPRASSSVSSKVTTSLHINSLPSTSCILSPKEL